NSAVRRTAVTELLVNGDRLSIRIRTADGQTHTLPTPYDPRGEIYVDYVVVDGRLWVRRVFDSETPPSRALVIDPSFQTVDWSSVRARHGKAIYRALSDGRWVITVTGDGSLGLERTEPGADLAPLAFAPEIRDFETIEEEVGQRIGRITWRDVFRQWFTGSSPDPSPTGINAGKGTTLADVPTRVD
ncbi:MAG: hypothetical protein ACNA8P_03585, partial [Phycisphaerales bacterium]